MARVFTEGFDAYNGIVANTGVAAKWTLNITNGTPFATVAGRFGGQALRIFTSGWRGFADRFLPAPLTSFAYGLAYYGLDVGTLSGHPTIIFMDSAGGYQCGMSITSAGEIRASRVAGMTSQTVLGTSATGVITNSAWHYIECEVVVDNSSGSFVIKVDGTTVVSVSGVDTQNSAVADIQRIRLGSNTHLGGSSGFYADDMYLEDTNSSLGESRVDTLRPRADTAQKDWVPSTGSVNYAMLDETLVDTSDYVEATAIGEEDLYDFDPLPSTPPAIHCVSVYACSAKTDAGTKKLQLPVDDGGGVDNGTALALGSTPVILEARTMSTKPSGGAWDATTVNAIQVGIRVNE